MKKKKEKEEIKNNNNYDQNNKISISNSFFNKTIQNL